MDDDYPYDMNAPLTAETWVARFHEFNYDVTFLLGYVDATRKSTPVLAKIAETAKDFDELKSQLLAFAKQQDDFVKDLDAKWYSDDPKQYGLDI